MKEKKKKEKRKKPCCSAPAASHLPLFFQFFCKVPRCPPPDSPSPSRLFAHNGLVHAQAHAHDAHGYAGAPRHRPGPSTTRGGRRNSKVAPAIFGGKQGRGTGEGREEELASLAPLASWSSISLPARSAAGASATRLPFAPRRRHRDVVLLPASERNRRAKQGRAPLQRRCPLSIRPLARGADREEREASLIWREARPLALAPFPLSVASFASSFRARAQEKPLLCCNAG